MTDVNEKPSLVPVQHLDDAHEALAHGAWAAARSWFEASLHDEETPEAFEGLAIAAWWQNDTIAFSARERAYRLFLDRGDARGAARVAAFHAVDFCSLRNEPAVANGWIQRARRLMRGHPPCPEQAMVAAWEGHIALMVHGDTTKAQTLCAEAMTIARSIGATDWEMLGLSLDGLARVIVGEIPEGMRRLDEAATAATTGAMHDLDAIGTVCCYLIHACERVRDFDRAAQWCELVKTVSTRWSERLDFSLCRAHYAGSLIRQGSWAEAEAELNAVIGELSAMYPAMAAEGIARLAELRRLQGRLSESAALFRQAEISPLRQPARAFVLLGRGTLALDLGQPATAADLAERVLRGIPGDNQSERVAGLDLLVRAKCALGRLDAAASALVNLRAIADDADLLPLRATARCAEGLVAAAGNHLTPARQCFEDAIDLHERVGARYEAALARLELATILARLGRGGAAMDEARIALPYLRQIGAERAVARAESLLSDVSASDETGCVPANALSDLTGRESEVLRLVARGQTNKEIAAHLGLSQHTVHRHLANILTKLRLPSRAAAAAVAARHDLV